MSQQINISIDLNKIDKSKIKNHANGARYYAITIDEKKEVDKFGNTHTAYDTQSKEYRANKVNKNYLGGGKEFKFNNQQTQQAPPTHAQPSYNSGPSVTTTFNPSPETIDDLPF